MWYLHRYVVYICILALAYDVLRSCVEKLFTCWYVVYSMLFFFFKQKTAYDMRISDCSSDVCSSDLPTAADGNDQRVDLRRVLQHFKRDGALSGDDVGFIERMNEGQAPFMFQLAAVGIGVIEFFAVKHDGRPMPFGLHEDRKSVVWGKSVSVRVDLGGRRIIKK